MRRRTSLVEAIYRASLRLFPSAFRDEYGEDVVQLVRDRRAEIDGTSRAARALFWLRALADIVTESLAERASRRTNTGIRRTSRRKGGGIMIDQLRGDVSHALRSIARAPGFTALVVLTFALAIGANTAIFSVLHGILLEPLPFGRPDALVALWETSAKEGEEKSETSAGLFLDWREKNQSFEDITAWTFDSSVVLQEEEEAVVLNAVLVYPNFFSVLELDPFFGRRFVMDDADLGTIAEPSPGKPSSSSAPPGGRGKVVILSHALWRDRFGADPGIVGRTIRLDGSPHTIVAVMRSDVAAPSSLADLWIPVAFQSPTRWERHVRRYTVYGRLREGITEAQAQQDLSRIAADLRSGEFKDIYESWDARLVPLREEIVAGSRPTLFAAFAAVGVVLLIACVNIGNMLLARSAGRRREMALRTAIGAGRRRLVAQLLTESLLIALVGGAIGIVVARAVHGLLLTFQPGILPRVEELSLDTWALGFAAAVTVACGLLFGLAPAFQALRVDVQRSLQQSGGRGSTGGLGLTRARAALVSAQLALATVLLSGAGLLTRTLIELGRVDPGFETEESVALRLFLDRTRYDSNEKLVEYYRRLGDRLADLPQVEAAGATSALPMDPLGINYDLPYRLEGQTELADNQLPEADFRVVTPGYFEALGVPLVAGRTFEAYDRANTTFVALVNETMARRAWPRGNAVGQRLETPSTEWHWFDVVGVVKDTRYYGLRDEPRPEIYVVHAQVPRAMMTFVVRTEKDPAPLTGLLRREVLKEDPAQPTHSLVPMSDLVADTVADEKFYTLVLGAFAALALTLAASGVFGVLSYWVAGKTQEIGVRMALGASRTEVMRSVLARGLGLGSLGAALGLIAALATSRAVESVLFGVSTTDGLTFAGVALLLLATALAACAIPAMRASRVDPIVALREE